MSRRLPLANEHVIALLPSAALEEVMKSMFSTAR